MDLAIRSDAAEPELADPYVCILGEDDYPEFPTEPGHEEDDDRNPPEGIPGIHYRYPMYNFYDPRGNGWAIGDRHPWMFRIATDANGEGSIVVRFPPAATRDPYVPGVENYRDVDGWMVWVAFMNSSIGFDKFKSPVPSRVFEVAVWQRQYWRLKFKGPPNVRSLMSLVRFINYSGMPPVIKPDVPVQDGPDHGDL
jgi:hypothetical protein